MSYLMLFLMFAVPLFLILLVLVQRGRGGGLVGALGGMGGQSAFGTKTGDVFTKVTIGVTVVWIVLCVAAIKVLNNTPSRLRGAQQPPVQMPADGPLGDNPAGAGAGGPGAGSDLGVLTQPTDGESAGEDAATEAPSEGDAAPSDSAPADAAPTETPEQP